MHAGDTAVAVGGGVVEEGLRQVQVELGAAWAAVDDLALVLVAVLASDGDPQTAERVVVRVAVAEGVEELLGNGDDGLLGGVVQPQAPRPGA